MKPPVANYTAIEMPTAPTSKDEYKYQIIDIPSMYDGDSVHVVALRSHFIEKQRIDFGFGSIFTNEGYDITRTMPVSVRMFGYDTAELKDSRSEFKAMAFMAKDYAAEWMETLLGMGQLWMETYKDHTGKYGRYLANFYDAKDELDTLKRYLIGNSLAVDYYGQNKKDIEGKHLANIDYLKTNSKAYKDYLKKYQ